VITCQRPPTEPGADRVEAGLMAFRQIPHESPLPRHLGQAFPVQAEQLMKNHALPSFETHALRQETVRRQIAGNSAAGPNSTTMSCFNTSGFFQGSVTLGPLTT